MSTSEPLTPSEVTAAPPAPPPQAPPPKKPAPRAFLLWWVLKKWLWRNTAGLIWAVLFWLLLGSVGALPPISASALPSSSLTSWELAVLSSFWLLGICEFQLTQVAGFFFYWLFLPIWAPVLGLVQYFRHRAGSFSTGRSPIKASATRVAFALILLLIFFWWPLPSARVALALGLLALFPGALLLNRTFRFALSPGHVLHSLAVNLHSLHEKISAAEVGGKPGEEGHEQFKGWRDAFMKRYYASVVRGLPRGLLRLVAFGYFSFLLLSSLLYVGFLGAVWLRAVTPDPSVLAAAVSRTHLPNLLEMVFICSLGVLGDWRINGTVLSAGGSAVVFLLNLVRVGTSLILAATFFGNYSADIARVEAELNAVIQPPSPPGPPAT